MAEIVVGIGASHSPLLNSPAEDYPKHAEKDAEGRPLLDKHGNKATYGELLEKADPKIRDEIRQEVLEEKTAACTRNIERLDQAIRDAELDALIIIGDDQNEQYGDDNMPAVLIYRGKTIINNPLNLGPDAPEFWRKARSQYHVKDESVEYPVAHELASHLIDELMDAEFDIAQANRLSDPHGEGHAFGYVHQRLMTGGSSRSCPSRSTPISRPTSLAQPVATSLASTSRKRCARGAAMSALVYSAPAG